MGSTPATGMIVFITLRPSACRSGIHFQAEKEYAMNNRNRNLETPEDRERRLAAEEAAEKAAYDEEAGVGTRAADPDLVDYLRQGFGRRLASAGVPYYE